jgi:hypothetical protein
MRGYGTSGRGGERIAIDYELTRDFATCCGVNLAGSSALLVFGVGVLDSLLGYGTALQRCASSK